MTETVLGDVEFAFGFLSADEAFTIIFSSWFLRQRSPPNLFPHQNALSFIILLLLSILVSNF